MSKRLTGQDFGNDYIRNNPNLRAPGAVDNIKATEWLEHLMELQKIKDDICYFAEKYMYIISLDKGKCIIKLYPKQAEFLKCLVDNKRVITLAARQTGKTTTYTIYVLWYVLTHKDKNVLICANKLKTATEILSRIKMAYEMLPNWLKTGVKQWNKTMIEFSNGCKVGAEATSGDSGRSFSINVLVVDEAAFIPPGMAEEFYTSVYPTVSSSKETQIIMVSTPNGQGNQFYTTWNKAILKIEDEGAGGKVRWTPCRIDWWDVPGRDEQWKQIQLESYNGDMVKFNQEFGNCVDYNTKIELYDKIENKYFTTTIGQFYQIIKQQKDNIERSI